MSTLRGRRLPAVAGLFYPSDPGELQGMVRSMLEEAGSRKKEDLAGASGNGRVLRAIIAPHAGYVYSGPVAASAYVYVGAAAGNVGKVAILGPSHRVPVRGLALSSAAEYEMPGFSLPADSEAAESLRRADLAEFVDEAHAAEHSIEVHLPFIKAVLGEVEVAAIAVGEASPDRVGAAVELLMEDPKRLVVISSDLSHYLDYDSAVAVDSVTAQAILNLRYEDIGYEQACGRNCIRGLLWAARRQGMHPQLLDLRNSGDTAGPRDSVVGYPAFAFWSRSSQP